MGKPMPSFTESTFAWCILLGVAGACLGGGQYGTWQAAATGCGIGLVIIPALVFAFLFLT